MLHDLTGYSPARRGCECLIIKSQVCSLAYLCDLRGVPIRAAFEVLHIIWTRVYYLGLLLAADPPYHIRFSGPRGYTG